VQSLLIVSFSRLELDARLRRQIALFSDRYEVVTAGFGPAVPGAARHIELLPPPGGLRRRMRRYAEAVLMRLRAHRLMYRTDPMVRSARRRLRGLVVDKVLANDIETVPLALEIAAPSRIHADLHEFYPGLHDDNAAWVRLRQPYYDWLVREHAPRVASVTTVGPGVAEAYLKRFEFEPRVVTNAPRFESREPSPVHTPLRLVHAGAALRERRLEETIRAVASSSADLRLTIHLTENDPAYLDELRALAASTGGRVTLLPPVPQPELVETLSAHDVGIHVMSSHITNQAVALPNKFFDFVQARLGVIVGPTPGMASLVREHGIGAVADGFDEASIRDVLDRLDAATVAQWKNAADAAAPALAAEPQLPVWESAVDALASAGP